MIAPALRSLIRRLWNGCLFEHADMVRERIKGRYVVVCARCGHSAAFPRQRLKVKRLQDKPQLVRHNLTPMHREVSK